MTSNRNWFSTYIPLPEGRLEVVLGDDTTLNAIGIDTIEIMTSQGEKLPLSQVLHVPELKYNLFSLGKVAKKGFEIHMIDNEIYVRNVISYVHANHAKLKAVPIESWHQRLGHANYQTVKKMASGDVVEGINCSSLNTSNECVACILGKMTRKSFSSSSSRATEPGELIHFDIMGPFEVESLSRSLFLAELGRVLNLLLDNRS